MSDPNHQRKEGGESAIETVGESAELGVEILSEGVVDMALDGASAAVELAGDLMGIENYLKRSFETSVNAFQTIRDIHPADKTATFFLERAQDLLQRGTPENWRGVVEMAGK